MAAGEESEVNHMAERATELTAKKRSYGEGSVTKRKDGRWVARFSLGTQENGRPKIKCLYGATRLEAQRKLKEFKRSYYQGFSFHPEDKTTLTNYILHWLEMYKQNALEASSYDRLEELFRNHIRESIGVLPLCRVTTHTVQELINQRTLTHAYSTVRKVKQLLDECFRHGVTTGDLQRNPMLGVVLPKKSRFKPEKQMQVLEDSEVHGLERVAAMVKASGRPVYLQAYLMIFLIHTGLRRGELLALEWTDIDWQKRTAQVNKALARVVNRDPEREGKYVYITKSTKSQKGNRVVPLNTKAIHALRRLQEIYLSLGVRSDRIACTRNGRPISHANLHLLLKSMLEKAGIEKELGIHQLRHTFASRALKAGVDISVVSQWLGHANISTTYNTYIHVFDSQKEEACQLLETL